MDALADEFAAQNVGSIFLYTHEAHPGENYPHLTSMSQKTDHARDLRDVYGVKRPILLDALDGACHRTYGSMPNMTWIFNKAGAPVYKSNWTDVNSVRNALEYYLDVVQRRRDRERLVPCASLTSRGCNGANGRLDFGRSIAGKSSSSASGRGGSR